MNEIKMTVELCPEDRARLDTIIEKLAAIGQSHDCAKCVEGVAAYMDKAADALGKPKEPDELEQKLDEVLERINKEKAQEAAENAQDAPKVLEHPTLEPFPETPTTKEEPSEAKPAVTMDMLRNKAITLAAAGKKDQVRAVVHPYAAKVTDLPENVWAEVYEKLCALEG
jgi:hypothetical protein